MSFEKTDLKLKHNLKHLLEEKRISVAELARKASVPKQTIFEWLMGSSPKDLTKLKRVALFFGISVDQLCFCTAIEFGQPTIQPSTPESQSLLNKLEDGVFEVRVRRVK